MTRHFVFLDGREVFRVVFPGIFSRASLGAFEARGDCSSTTGRLHDDRDGEISARRARRDARLEFFEKYSLGPFRLRCLRVS